MWFLHTGNAAGSKALLDGCHHPSFDEICAGLKHNYCRCTGYVKIIKAVKRAAEMLYPEENQDNDLEDLERTCF